MSEEETLDAPDCDGYWWYGTSTIVYVFLSDGEYYLCGNHKTFSLEDCGIYKDTPATRWKRITWDSSN